MGLRVLFNHATRKLDLEKEQDVIKAAGIASLMRDVGLKTISFNGIPKSINCLAALRMHLPDTVKRQLRSESIRSLNKSNVADIVQRGHALFEDIYHPITDKLLERLASNHPDMAAYIVENHYGALLSDHPSEGDNREIVSIVAVACLRGSGGVAPQVMSHVLGLRKASQRSDASWLTTENGAMWVLSTIDKIRETVQQRGSKL